MAERVQTTPIRLLNDYWPEEDQRVEAGNIIELPLNDAMKLLEQGKATRADKLGG